MALPPDRAQILTEQSNPRSHQLHRLDVGELVALIQEEDRAVLPALERARPSLIALISAAEPGFLQGGRLVYIGAGTSGRLGVLDASEAPPTFQVDPGRVVGIIAGGDGSLRRSSEGREDDLHGAREALSALQLRAQDTLIGIAAGGTTPYVLGALALAKAACAGLVTALLTCAVVARPPAADHLVVLETGPEVITGSTRMKAGTATKLALNTISTALMVRLGKVYGNLMVDCTASNDKLRDRAARIIATLTGLDRSAAFAVLEAAGGSARVAVVMARLGLGREDAMLALTEAGGRLDRVLEPG